MASAIFSILLNRLISNILAILYLKLTLMHLLTHLGFLSRLNCFFSKVWGIGFPSALSN